MGLTSMTYNMYSVCLYVFVSDDFFEIEYVSVIGTMMYHLNLLKMIDWYSKIHVDTLNWTWMTTSSSHPCRLLNDLYRRNFNSIYMSYWIVEELKKISFRSCKSHVHVIQRCSIRSNRTRNRNSHENIRTSCSYR
jgi:hypothetical protein